VKNTGSKRLCDVAGGRAWSKLPDLSPCVSAAQWLEPHLRWCRPAGWRV